MAEVRWFKSAVIQRHKSPHPTGFTTFSRHKASLIRLRLVRAPAAVWCVEYDGLLVVRVAEVGREVRLQVLVLARLRLATDARHVDAGAF